MLPNLGGRYPEVGLLGHRGALISVCFRKIIYHRFSVISKRTSLNEGRSLFDHLSREKLKRINPASVEKHQELITKGKRETSYPGKA